MNSVSFRSVAFFTLTMLFVIVSCGKNAAESIVQPYLNIVPKSLILDEEGQGKILKVKCNTDWNFSYEGDWMNIVKVNEGLEISAERNPNAKSRIGSVKVFCQDVEKESKIEQLGWGAEIKLPYPKGEIGAAGGKKEITCNTNVKVKIVCDEPWVKTSSTITKAKELVEKNIEIVVSSNPSKEERIAKILIEDEEGNAESVTYTLCQSGLNEYKPNDPSEIADKIKIIPTGAKASSSQPNYDISKTYDGNYRTQWESNWSNIGDNYFPITAEWYFEGGVSMDNIVYYPRLYGQNGNFKEIEIYLQKESGTWELFTKETLNNSNDAVNFTFPKTQTAVTGVRFKIISGYGDGQGFATCSEMEFYKNPEGTFNWKTLFTDQTCSELKPGVTEDDINKCTNDFFRSIAYYLLNDSYDSEFRVDSFRAWPSPWEDAKSHKTTTKGYLNNPTGIVAVQGKPLVIFADLKGQRGISLKVMNLDVPGGDGYGGISYPINDGLNKINVSETGLVYVMYEKSDYERCPKIKLHFATGNVNGYFDSQNSSHEGREAELLNNASYKYFDLVGKYAQITFETDSYKKYAPGNKILELMNFYDNLVFWEQAFMGNKYYDKMYRNRSHLVVIYKSFMYSAGFHTAYNVNTMSYICNPDEAVIECWGPAHEIGHSNQTKPGFCWAGTTEVTNNVMSEYIQTSIFKQPSRVQIEDLGGGANRYTNAWNDIVVGHQNHPQHPDVFCKLIPFWQLQLYFGKALGRTPDMKAEDNYSGFYPDVYEYFRTHKDSPKHGQNQLDFTYVASLCARANLFDFFKKWGFYNTVNNIKINDYGTYYMTITEEMVEDIKKKIDALGYPKPDGPIEYITDNNYDAFRDKKPIVKGKASRSGNVISTQDWENVIVYEVRDGGKDGKLIYVSDGELTESSSDNFNISKPWSDTYKVYAVQYDGEQIEVVL